MIAGGAHLTDRDAAMVIYAARLDPQLEARVEWHIAECADCAAKLAALRESDREAGELLSLLDVPVPGTSAQSVLRAAKVSRRHVWLAPRRVAAGIVAFLVLAAAAAAAIPSSPLHRLIFHAPSPNVMTRARSVPQHPAEPGAPSGVLIAPPASLEIVFNNQNEVTVHLRITDSQQVALSSSDAAATYRVGSNRIIVSQSGRAIFQLEIPHTMGDLRIVASGTVIFSRRARAQTTNDTITISIPAPKRG